MERPCSCLAVGNSFGQQMIPAMNLDALLAQCAPTVAPSTMRAIVKVESGGKPFAIGYLVRSKDRAFTLSRQPSSKDEAVSWAQWFLANGYRFDAGPAQVNSINFAAHHLTAETVFDSCRNLQAGAAILTAEYRRALKTFRDEQAALRAAISSYNSGNFSVGFKNGYVTKVQTAALGPSTAGRPAASTPTPSLIPVPKKKDRPQ